MAGTSFYEWCARLKYCEAFSIVPTGLIGLTSFISPFVRDRQNASEIMGDKILFFA